MSYYRQVLTAMHQRSIYHLTSACNLQNHADNVADASSASLKATAKTKAEWHDRCRWRRDGIVSTEWVHEPIKLPYTNIFNHNCDSTSTAVKLAYRLTDWYLTEAWLARKKRNLICLPLSLSCMLMMINDDGMRHHEQCSASPMVWSPSSAK